MLTPDNFKELALLYNLVKLKVKELDMPKDEFIEYVCKGTTGLPAIVKGFLAQLNEGTDITMNLINLVDIVYSGKEIA